MSIPNSLQLVTTAEKYALQDDTKVLFLGEWCKIYGQENQQFDSVTASYHWDDRNKLFEDYQYLTSIYEKLLSELSSKLNELHSVNYSTRYWRIVVGPWLGYFIQVLFDRWFMLDQVTKQYQNLTCSISDRDLLSAVPNDMDDFTAKSISDNWNEVVYGYLLSQYFADKIQLSKVPTSINIANKNAIQKTSNLKKIVIKCVNIYNSTFCRESEYFFISSYLPLITDCKLQVKLKQFPKRWRQEQPAEVKTDNSRRNWSLPSTNNPLDIFEQVVRKMVPLLIPKTYLEGYQATTNKIAKLGWPKRPKAIFTSNNYMLDDIFKLWAAGKVTQGAPLVIGQHGGNFGMNPFAFHEEHQIKISDRWISWGWVDSKKPQVIPVGNLKCLDKNVKYNPNGFGLMVEMELPRYSYHLMAMPIAGQFINYFDEQKEFLNYLPLAIRRQIVLRLYRVNRGWNQKSRWNDEFPNLKLDSGIQNIKKLIKQSRVYISTYNATTFLESLAWNVPTIIFWNPNHWELNQDVKPFFAMLKSVGIFHETPESAAKQLLAIWNNVPEWWSSKEIQNARLSFCNQYSKPLNKPVTQLSSLLNDVVK